MNKRLISSELRSSIRQFLIFAILIFITLIASFVVYPFIGDDIASNILKINKTVRCILYLPDNIKNGNEYYCFVMEYLIILGSIMASHLSTKLMLADRKNGYVEYLFALPISRGKIFLNKCLCILLELLVFNILFYVISITLSSVSTYHVSIRYILEINSAMFLSQLTFAALGLLAGALIRNPRYIYLKSDIVIFILLALAIPQRVFDITLIKFINPFSYLAVKDLLLADGYKKSFIIASGFIVLFSLTISKSIYDEYEV